MSNDDRATIELGIFLGMAFGWQLRAQFDEWLERLRKRNVLADILRRR